MSKYLQENTDSGSIFVIQYNASKLKTPQGN